MSKLRMFAKLKAKKKDDKKATVEGDAPRQRLDRPSRLRRADGGVTLSDDSKKAISTLRREAAEEQGPLGFTKSLTRPKYNDDGVMYDPERRVPAPGQPPVRNPWPNPSGKTSEANRIERGQAEPGKEDRKRGGRVKS